MPKETLILIDGKRIAQASLFGGYDIQLIPFSMIDHIDILKDGASAVYGADAVAGVVNFFLIHKFRGLEIGGNYGNTNMGASNDMGEWEAWLKAGTGDDKTDIVVIADFYQRTGGLFSRDRDISSNGNLRPLWRIRHSQHNFPGRVQGERLIPSLFFSANSPPPRSAANVSTSPFYTPSRDTSLESRIPRWAMGNSLPLTSQRSRRRSRRRTARWSTARSPGISATNT